MSRYYVRYWSTIRSRIYTVFLVLGLITSGCGHPGIRMKKVYGGTSSTHGQWPWQAWMRTAASNCGATIISSRLVVTAAHCV